MNFSILYLAAGMVTFAACFILWQDVIKGCRISGQKQSRWVMGLLLIAIALNIWAIHLMDSFTANGINFTLATGASIGILIVQGIYVVGVLRHHIRGLGLFLLPGTTIVLLLIPILPKAHEPNWVQTSSLLETTHLLISLLAYGILTFAAIHAAMQIMLNRALKKKRLTPLMQALPSLFDIERHMMAQVKIASILLVISIFSGLSWQWVDYHHFAIFHYKILLAFFSLGVLILLQIKRYRSDWPTHIVSRAVIGAYILLMLAYFGVDLMHGWLH